MNLPKYKNKMIFKNDGNIWNRIVRANIYIKGLYLLNDITLNIYKNAWDDLWFITSVLIELFLTNETLNLLAFGFINMFKLIKLLMRLVIAF